MKRISFLGATLMAASCLASMPGAQAATECQADIVKGRTGHWTYRLIDGRKCWYEGKAQLPKSELFWPGHKEPAVVSNPPAPNVQSTNAQASPPPAAESEENNDPEDGSCCWPPQQKDTFETRWHSFGPTPRN